MKHDFSGKNYHRKGICQYDGGFATLTESAV